MANSSTGAASTFTLIQAALGHHRAGRLAQAEALYRQVLQSEPDNPDALHLLGALARQAGKYAVAADFIGRAIHAKPAEPVFHNSLGLVLKDSGKLDEAVASYRRAASVKPDYAEAHYNLGNVLQLQGRLDEAVASYRKALTLKPDHAEAHCNLGSALQAQVKLNEAEASYRRAISLKPNHAEAHYNLGNVLQEQNRSDQAIASYRMALTLKPDYPKAHSNLGKALQEQGKFDEAIACYRQALALRPDVAEVHCNLGGALRGKGRLDEAVSCYRQALMLKPDFIEAHFNLGGVLAARSRHDEALGEYRRVLALDPGYPGVKIRIVEQSMQMCEWKDLQANIGEIRRQEQDAVATHDDRVGAFSLLLPGVTAAEQRRYAEKYAQENFRQLVPLREKLGFTFSRRQNGKIHLGYLSADLHDHATARLMAELFELHDRTRFNLSAYSYGPDDGSAMRERISKAFDRFVDIRDYSFEQAARKIYADRVDILIDLKGYSMLSRSGILALRPAPIQVNYLGYPGTMGADFVDYLIADRFIIPPEHFAHYTEKVVWLPDCYQPTDRTRPRLAAPTRRECGLPEAGVVFCSLNQTYKITPDVFDIWCRLLTAMPGSTLWLWANNPYAESNLKREAESRGVSPERLVMAPRLKPERHLARLQCADLFLDTTPVNAHTTCSDALWMGLPVITCAGETFPSRVAGSLLTAMGLPELITYNLEDYFRLALELATDEKKRKELREKIIANRDSAPLFDTARLTRNLEQAYEKMWAEYYLSNVSDQNA
ncbi:MAG: tetratricopeptide repeat protein [Gallionellaceae bacterium]